MPTRARKARRYRGTRTHGYGQIGQHRHSGSRGGHGKAGLHKHKWSWLNSAAGKLAMPSHFGRDPFKAPGMAHVKPSTWVNVGELGSLAMGKKELDLAAMGFEKLLGSGAAGGPYIVKVGSFTKKAQAKIEAAGGKILVQE